MLLIIEDEEILADMLDAICGGIDHKIITSYIDLLNIPVLELSKITCVLTDMNLDKEYTAHHVIEYMSSQNIEVNMILMTGGSPSAKTISLFDGILYKPFKKEDLIAMIED